LVREIAPQDAHDAAWRTRDEREDIVQALRGLPATQRAALILHHSTSCRSGRSRRQWGAARPRSSRYSAAGGSGSARSMRSRTVDDDQLLLSLRRIAEPVEPPAAFLDAMYETLAEELGFRRAPLGETLALRPRPRAWSGRLRRHAWLVAAALVALAIVGGAIWSVRCSTTVSSRRCRHSRRDDLSIRCGAIGRQPGPGRAATPSRSGR
jgi:hypothetical protein